MPALADCSTVRLAEPGWTDLALTTAVTQVLLEGMGHETETEILGIPVIYEAMKAGDLDVFMGYWDPAMETYFNAYRDTGEIETIHTNLEGAKFTWAVPSYVHEAGVTSFADLAAQEDKFGGKLYGIEPGSNDIMLEIVEKDEFGLGDWDVVESSEQGMLAQVSRFYKNEEPVVFLGWEPHPMNANFDLKYLPGGEDFFGGEGVVHTVTRQGFSEECPNLGKLFSNMDFTLDMENKIMGQILDDGADPADATEAWLKENPQVLDAWLDGVTTVDGGDAMAAVKDSLGM